MLTNPENLRKGDLVREHIGVEHRVYLILEEPAILGHAQYGKWKVYNVRQGTTYRIFFFDSESYEVLQRSGEE